MPAFSKPASVSLGARRALAAALIALTMLLFVGGRPASADRWGTPYAARVTANTSAVYTQPDRASVPVGPLWREAIVVVLDIVTGADGNDWSQIPDGFIPTSDLSEMLTLPWTAEVSAPSVSVYAYPFATSTIMRTASQGDLLRVMGVAKGLEGDTGIWWATTAGYVPLGTLKWATNDWAGWWKLPASSDAPKGWWGAITQQAHVRTAPSLDAPVVGVFNGGEYVKVLAEEQGSPIDGNTTWYRIDGGRYAGGRIHSSVVQRLPDPAPNTTAPEGGSASGSWIVVDRSNFSLTFVRGGQAVFTTYVSLGKAGVDTPTGTYTTFGKFIGDRMSSRNVQNPSHPYDLPNVPFTEYYKDGGYAIHGTYWHDVFGTRESQGCINLTWSDAAYLFGLTLPAMPGGSTVAWGSGENQTPVVILD
ncbi:MAG TPA: L,D-transpeptidase family protein [Chloroflexota bacterium]